MKLFRFLAACALIAAGPNAMAADLVVEMNSRLSIPQQLQPGESLQHLRFTVQSGRVDSVTVTNSPTTAAASSLAELRSHQTTTFAGDDYRSPEFYADVLSAFLAQQPPAHSSNAIEDRSWIDGEEILTVAISNPGSGATLIFHGSENLQVEEVSDLKSLAASAMANAYANFIHSSTVLSPSSSSPEYLIVTSSELAGAFAPLLQWKAIKGLSAGIVTMNQVLALSWGNDDAEKLRNFLIERYNSGTRYVLLGGDESIVPIRYAFYANTTSMPTIDLLQICDLYYADVDGVWDVDGDGVYGEPTQDSPDLSAELMVGRLPVSTPEQVANYVTKLIKYEQNPNDGNYGYLPKSLFAAADQMRDFDGVGQQTLLADSLPAGIVADTTDLIEAPSGYATDPSYPTASPSIQKLSEGWGVISLLIHGRYDGWVIRSNQYNQWPKSFILTGAGTDDTHGYLSNVPTNNMPGLVYSIGCNNGAFDMDTPPFPSANPAVVTEFLDTPDGGAVVFVGYSRWGWVATSWKFERAFLDYLYHTDNHPAAALRYAKLLFPYYRDECYGLNLDGDPETEIWTETPKSLSLALPNTIENGESQVQVAVLSNSQPLSDALVTLVKNGAVVSQEHTDGSGLVDLAVDFNSIDTFSVYAYKDGYATSSGRLNPQLVLGTGDDITLPKEFRIFQNYPNPFNPATTIAFELDRPAEMTLDIFNVLGQKVKTVVQQQMATGRHQADWDGSDDSGLPVSSGVYFAKIRTQDRSEVIKMCLLK